MAGILIANFFVRRVFYLAAATAYFCHPFQLMKSGACKLQTNLAEYNWQCCIRFTHHFYFTITCLLSVVKNLSKTKLLSCRNK
jgi:hypothetical protein